MEESHNPWSGKATAEIMYLRELHLAEILGYTQAVEENDQGYPAEYDENTELLERYNMGHQRWTYSM
jgi:hypothetical protein